MVTIEKQVEGRIGSAIRACANCDTSDLNVYQSQFLANLDEIIAKAPELREKIFDINSLCRDDKCEKVADEITQVGLNYDADKGKNAKMILTLKDSVTGETEQLKAFSDALKSVGQMKSLISKYSVDNKNKKIEATLYKPLAEDAAEGWRKATSEYLTAWDVKYSAPKSTK